MTDQETYVYKAPPWVHDFVRRLDTTVHWTCAICGHRAAAHAREHPQGPMFCLDCKAAKP